MSGTKVVLVQCTWVIPVQVPIEWDDTAIEAEIENRCPGTGIVGEALRSRMQGASGCWACPLGGRTKIISVEGASYGSETPP